MTPHQIQEISQPLSENVSVRKEILFNGFFYDVTDFMGRHPGGNVIQFYTEKGEDATQAIQQFHFRSMNRIHQILKSFKKRPASDEEFGLNSSQLLRHKELTKDFTMLFLEIQMEGLFDPSYWRICWRILECFLFWGAAVYLFSFFNWYSNILGCCFAAMGSGRAGWLQHEGGHHSLTGVPKWDRILDSVFMGLFMGNSGRWYAKNHSMHHAMPQRVNHDVDLRTMPFLAYNAKLVKDPKKGKTFLIQNQTWLFFTMDCLVASMTFIFYGSPRSALKHRNYLDLFFISLHFLCMYTLCPNLLCIFFIYWLGANYTFGNFALSHTHLPVTECPTHWVEYGLTHTANIKSSLWVDWWMGYLNYQIEHHLFPTLPQFRSYLIKERVKALAQKYGLPYYELGYKEAVITTLKNFSDVAKQLNVNT